MRVACQALCPAGVVARHQDRGALRSACLSSSTHAGAAGLGGACGRWGTCSGLLVRCRSAMSDRRLPERGLDPEDVLEMISAASVDPAGLPGERPSPSPSGSAGMGPGEGWTQQVRWAGDSTNVVEPTCTPKLAAEGKCLLNPPSMLDTIDEIDHEYSMLGLSPAGGGDAEPGAEDQLGGGFAGGAGSRGEEIGAADGAESGAAIIGTGLSLESPELGGGWAGSSGSREALPLEVDAPAGVGGPMLVRKPEWAADPAGQDVQEMVYVRNAGRSGQPSSPALVRPTPRRDRMVRDLETPSPLDVVSEALLEQWRSARQGRWTPGQMRKRSTQYAYLTSELRSIDQERYAAAGSLLYITRPDGCPMVLLGRKSTSARGGGCLALLGGKREDRDAGPEATAMREIGEESGGLLKLSGLQRVGLKDRVLWLPSGRYVLFFHELPYSNHAKWLDIPGAFEGLRKAVPGVRGSNHSRAEMQSLHWVPLDYLRRYAQEEAEEPGRGTGHLHPFLLCLLRCGVVAEVMGTAGQESFEFPETRDDRGRLLDMVTSDRSGPRTIPRLPDA